MRARHLFLLTLAAACVAATAACDDGEGKPLAADVLDANDDTSPTADATSGDTQADISGDTQADISGDTQADIEGTCEPVCGANQTCEPQSNTCLCLPGFGDCNADPEDGCEQALDQPQACGHCGPGEHCDAFGIEPVCQVLAPGLPGSCDATRCLDGYHDLDGATTTGCETGVVLRGAAGGQDLSGSLTGSIVALAHDGTTLFALTENGDEYSVHAIAVDENGDATVVDSELVADSNDRHSIAVYDGYVAVAAFGQTIVYHFDGTALSQIGSASAAGASEVAAVTLPQVANAQAEFVAAIGNGIAWYGVFAQQSDAPATATCFAGGRVCRLATSTLPPNAAAIAVASLGGATWAVAAGDVTVEHGFDASVPEFDAAPAAGATIPHEALDIEPLGGNRLAVVQSDGVHVYQYTMSATDKPQTRTDSYTVTPPSGTATDLAVLDDQRLLVGTTAGLLAVYLDGTAQSPMATVAQPMPRVDAVAVGDGWAFAAAGRSLVALQLDLMPIE